MVLCAEPDYEATQVANRRVKRKNVQHMGLSADSHISLANQGEKTYIGSLDGSSTSFGIHQLPVPSLFAFAMFLFSKSLLVVTTLCFLLVKVADAYFLPDNAVIWKAGTSIDNFVVDLQNLVHSKLTSDLRAMRAGQRRKLCRFPRLFLCSKPSADEEVSLYLERPNPWRGIEQDFYSHLVMNNRFRKR